mmetsp:Transcript_4671/g.10408  ORF Transcript_4671/g.10408 Transcript_4671/m.10408 type:complete len:207 (-) Transcript_4671:3051-3671(-)
MSSSRSTTLAKESRKIPDRLASTSILGLPSSSILTRSNRTTLPVPSFTGFAPTRERTMAMDSPRVLIVSRPHNVTAVVSGNFPSLLCWCCLITSSAASWPLIQAPADGIRYGSRACIFFPVGSTDVPSRNRSPPGFGGTYPPSRAVTTASSSSVLRDRSETMSVASVHIESPSAVLILEVSSSAEVPNSAAKLLSHEVNLPSQFLP